MVDFGQQAETANRMRIQRNKEKFAIRRRQRSVIGRTTVSVLYPFVGECAVVFNLLRRLRHLDSDQNSVSEQATTDAEAQEAMPAVNRAIRLLAGHVD